MSGEDSDLASHFPGPRGGTGGLGSAGRDAGAGWIADAAGGVTDEAWANAAKHYDEDQLVALMSLIAVINAYNRINVINRQPAGTYRPGQFG